MHAEVTIPSLGVAMESAILLTWLKQEGAAVETDEPIAEIETDKSTLELLAPTSGRLGPHLYEEGDEIPVGEAVAVVLGEGEAQAGSPTSSQPTAAAQDAAPSGSDDRSPEARKDTPPDERRPRRNSPRARRLAAEAAEAEASAQPSASPPSGRFRDLIAKRVSESWREIPHFTVVREVQADALVEALGRLRVSDPSVTLTDLLLRAQALAVAEDDSSDLGLAVASDHGVMIPVVRDVLGRALSDLATARAAAVERGRAGRLAPDDSPLPTSTLSNLGPFGVDSFTGIVATGQTTLFTLGAIRRVAVVRDEEVVPASAMMVTVNADHRAQDGADVAKALKRFAEVIEDPGEITIEGTVR